MPIMKDEKVQEAFLKALDYDPKHLKKVININMNKAADELQKHIESLKKELERIQNRKKKWQIAYANDGITLEELKDHTREDKELEEAIQKELQQIPQDQAPKMSREETIEKITLIRELWKRSENEKVKKAFIRDVFESITVECESERSHGGPGNFAEVVVVDFKFRF
jgi:site-specific DNA recombinase